MYGKLNRVVAVIAVIFTVLAFGASMALSRQAAQLRGETWVWQEALMEIGIMAAVVIAVVVTIGLIGVGVDNLIQLRNKRTLQKLNGEPQWTMEGTVLTRHQKTSRTRGLLPPVLTGEEQTIITDLADIRYASSELDLFDRYDVETIAFWDADPKMEFMIFGPTQTNPEAQKVAEFELPDFLTMPASIKEEVVQYLDNQQVTGLFASQLDLRTGELVRDKLSPLAAGVEVSGRRITSMPRKSEENAGAS